MQSSIGGGGTLLVHVYSRLAGDVAINKAY